MFKNIFGFGKKSESTSLSEFEWMAVTATNALDIKPEHTENLTTFYNSDIKWCVIRHFIEGEKSFYLLDYGNLKHFPIQKKMIYMNLDNFLIYQEVNLKVVFRIEEEILNIIKKTAANK